MLGISSVDKDDGLRVKIKVNSATANSTTNHNVFIVNLELF